MRFADVIDTLERFYGRPKPPAVTDPLGMILLENAAYLVDDDRRQAAFDTLRKQIGLNPSRIQAASAERLLAVAERGGAFPAQRVGKLRRVAELALDLFDGDLNRIPRLSLTAAKRALRKFPGIGEPGAEKILLFAEAYPIPALESNGLRVLVRLGFGKESKNYSTTYRSAQKAIEGQFPADCDWLIRAHQLLRRHGQEICRRTIPECEVCPLASGCEYRNRGRRLGG